MANVTITQLPNAGTLVGTESVPIVQNGVTVQTTTGAIAAASGYTGTVTSVAATVPSFLSIGGSPITSSGTLAISYSGTALPVANGGTGVTTSTGTGSTVLSTSPSLTTPTQTTYETWTPISAPSYAEGRLWYDSDQKALAYYNDATNNAVHIGQETVIKVKNNTGSTIAAGAPVYITSTSSGSSYPNVALAKADVPSTAAVIGITNSAISSGGGIGYAVSAGMVTGVSTGAFTVGDVLYLSPYSAGQFMNTVPPTGYAVQVGVVAYSNSPNGSIYTKQTTPLAISAATIVGTLAVAAGGTGAASLAAASIATYAGTETLTNKRVNPRVLPITANTATPTINTDSYDMVVITGQSTTITSFTTNLTGTPVNGQKLWISITGTSAVAITSWGSSFESSTTTLPTTTVSTNRLDVGFVWNAAGNAGAGIWRCVAVA